MTNHPKYSKQVITKYILLQIPAIILLTIIILWLYFASVISFPTVLFILLLWIFKDIVLFFFVWKAYEVTSDSPMAKTGIAIDDLNPDGYVEVGSELWRATADDKGTRIEKGDRIIIKSVKGLTLSVTKPENEPKQK
jgi:membrane-bound ClpP family serine protease